MKLGEGHGSISTFGDKVRITIGLPGAQLFVDADATEVGQFVAEISEALRLASVHQRQETMRNRSVSRLPHQRTNIAEDSDERKTLTQWRR